MRPRAGNAISAIFRNGRTIWLLQDSHGRWLTTGAAAKWPRCRRCRRPFDLSPFNSGLCHICYFYKNGLDVKEFWRLHDEGYYLAPYNIGKRLMSEESAYVLFDLSNPQINWRARIRAQTQ